MALISSFFLRLTKPTNDKLSVLQQENLSYLNIKERNLK